MVTEATPDDLDATDGPAVVLFWTAGDEVCEAFKPLFASAARDHDDPFLTIEVDPDDRRTRERFGLQALPAVAVFEDGDLVHRMQGALSEMHLEMLLAGLGEEPDEPEGGSNVSLEGGP